jgi:hypothetical protein
MAALANQRSQRAGLGRRAVVGSWDRQRPRFPPRYFHHAMAIEPLRGEAPEPLFAAVAKALKPGGQFVLDEVVADQPLDPREPLVEKWARLDHRAPTLPGEPVVTRNLEQLGFDVRISEDVSQRPMHQALKGWSAKVQMLRVAHPAVRGPPPTPGTLACDRRSAIAWLSGDFCHLAVDRGWRRPYPAPLFTRRRI